MPGGSCSTAATRLVQASCLPQALAREPDQPALLLGAGVAAHLLGRSKEATVPLRRALDLDPRLTPASILLGQIVYGDGNVADAIKIYEKALTHAPNHPHLTAKLKAWRADADASTGFTERRFDRFRVMFQGHADNGARRTRDRDSRIGVLADRQGARHVSIRASGRDALHGAAVPRCHAGADVGRRHLRWPHPRARGRRGAESAAVRARARPRARRTR